MSKNSASLRLVALCVIFSLPGFAHGQVLADRLPPETTLYVGWQGVDPAAPGFQGSHFQEFLADSHIPAVVDDFIPKLLDRLAKEDKDAAEAADVIRNVAGPLWRHPTAIALVGIEIDKNTGPKPKIIVLCQAGAEMAALKAKVSELLLKQPGKPPFPVNLIEKGDILALVIGYDHPDAAIPDAGGQSLANNPEFVKTLAQVDKGAFFTAYVDVEKLLVIADTGVGMAPPEIQKNWEKARDLLGLKGVKRGIITEGFDGKDWGSQAFLAAPAPRSGLIGSMLDSKPLSDEILRAIPGNATLAGATHFDLGGLVTAVRSGVSSFDPDAAKQIDDVFDQVNKTVGMDVQKDLLANLGDEWAYYVDPAVAGNGIVGATLINRLKDPAKAEAAFIKLEEFINKFAESQLKDEKVTIAFRKMMIDNVTVHYLGLPLVTPAWVVQDGNLYVGLYPEVVAAAANHVANKGKTLESNPAFVALGQRLGNQPVSSFAFIDIPKRTPENYGSWLVISHIANAGDLFGVPAPLQILPPLNKLMTHLSAAGRVEWTDADGAHSRGISAFPGSEVFATDQTTLIYEESMMMGLMMPLMSRARVQAVEVRSASNLKQIGVAAMIYANGHNGKFPKDFGELVAGGDLPISVFVNGNNVTPAGLTAEQSAQWVREHSDYVWNGAEKDSTKIGAEDPIAWENPATAQDGVIYFLYGDGHVSEMPTPEASLLIAKAQKPAPGL